MTLIITAMCAIVCATRLTHIFSRSVLIIIILSHRLRILGLRDIRSASGSLPARNGTARLESESALPAGPQSPVRGMERWGSAMQCRVELGSCGRRCRMAYSRSFYSLRNPGTCCLASLPQPDAMCALRGPLRSLRE